MDLPNQESPFGDHTTSAMQDNADVAAPTLPSLQEQDGFVGDMQSAHSIDGYDDGEHIEEPISVRTAAQDLRSRPDSCGRLIATTMTLLLAICLECKGPHI